MFRYFYIGFAILLIWVVILVNKLIPVPLFQEPDEIVNPVWEKASQFNTEDSLSFQLVYANLEKHFAKPAYQDVLGGLYFRDDKTPEEFYRKIAVRSSEEVRKYGRFGLALIYKNWQNYDLVLEELNEITEKDAGYYTCELGCALLKKGHYQDAVHAFKKELTFKDGNRKSANEGLAQAYHMLDDYAAIHAHMADPVFAQNCPDYILEKEYYLHGPLIKYLSLVLAVQASWDLVVAAALIALLWAFYYSRFKIFAAKDYVLYTFVFVVSCIVTLSCTVLYDTFHYVFKFTQGQTLLSGLRYMIFGVGVIEEFVKSIPVFICLLIFKNRIKEPVDFLLLATMSAIGFAFMENIIYFDRYFGADSYSIIHKRTVLAVIMHVFCSAVIWYGYIQTKLIGKFYYVLIGTLVSISTHGFYDFFLELPSSEGFYIFSFVMVVLSFFALKAFYNSALNHSPFFRFDINFPTETTSFAVVAGLCFVILFEFILNAISFGAPHANDSLLSSLLAYVTLVVIYSSNISRIILSRNHWIKMSSIFASSYSAYRTHGNEVVLLPAKKSHHGGIYPLYGKIIGQENYAARSDNYIIHLSTPIQHNNFPVYNILASFVSNTNQPHRIYTKLYYESNRFVPDSRGIVETNMVLLDYCIMETAMEKPSWLYQISWNWKSLSAAVAVFLILLFSFVGFMNYSTSIDYYRGAERSLSTLDVFNASEYCKGALHFNKKNYEARMLFAKIRMDGNFPEEALDDLHEVTSVPTYIGADYYAVEGLAYYQLAAYDLALQSFLKCHEYNNQFDSLYWYESNTYGHLNNSVEALNTIRLFLADKKHAGKDAYKRAGDLYMSLKKYDEAYFYFDALVKNKEYYTHALLQRGICKYYMNKKEEACIDIETAHSYDNPAAIDYLNQWCRQEIEAQEQVLMMIE
ncbi:PrsW family glutamic-type intramembrane protease [Cytophaga hutchinsonii]|uniref:Membrane protein, with TPR repeat n=1 Tax=Cytophaga hutchinsonii (strain ATCC 33406 / DSM 1761 / CIP 103989 / NBRC 15051 / NCIMB 9469 / D465) TaxID=269798 RepID=A0A6N4STS7_CYTH3|nr:PrsW family glutamic-type intramembrane protease [Cytophaga hutchinsonii]ABG59864.1 membrane protein, with TPR repeat [Cytophaga hutchinsonii ATCC 33406]SFX28517.1 Membrane proteinase PrsW, cleaves anti-sigma factor RsiW, M82 family [Cytophaga hutchinsonii ATCC 33406]